MLEIIKRLLGREDQSSKTVAKERLRLVLVHDRAGVSPEVLQKLKVELIQVISNYMEIDEHAIEVSLDSCDNQVALVANIPVKNMKRTAQSETA